VRDDWNVVRRREILTSSYRRTSEFPLPDARHKGIITFGLDRNTSHSASVVFPTRIPKPFVIAIVARDLLSKS
jgi:hypothetical protein